MLNTQSICLAALKLCNCHYNINFSKKNNEFNVYLLNKRKTGNDSVNPGSCTILSILIIVF